MLKPPTTLSGQVDGQEITAAPVLIPKNRPPPPRRNSPPRNRPGRWGMGGGGRSPPRYISKKSLFRLFLFDVFISTDSAGALPHVDALLHEETEIGDHLRLPVPGLVHLIAVQVATTAVTVAVHLLLRAE